MADRCGGDGVTDERVQWTPDMVRDRLAEAALVLGSLPAMHVYRYSSNWPRLLLDCSCMVVHRAGPSRLPGPSPAAISRMEEVLGWSMWLTPVDSRIAWQRANGRRWKQICQSTGLARAAANEHWRYALCLIARRLNGKPAPTRLGRRALIERFRDDDRSGREIDIADTFVSDSLSKIR